MASEGKQVGFFLFDGVDLLCTSGPASLLVYASRQLARQGEPGYEIDYFSAFGGPAVTAQGLTVETRPLKRRSGASQASPAERSTSRKQGCLTDGQQRHTGTIAIVSRRPFRP